MNQRISRRRFKIILLYLLVLSPWIIGGVIGALRPVANSPLDWVDDSFAPRSNYDAFSKRFGGADVVVISWPGCTIDNAALDGFTEALRTSPSFFDGDRWLFERVVSGRELYRSFAGPQMGLGQDQIRQRLAGSLLGPDGVTTATVIAFSEAGLRQRGRLVPLIRIAASKHAAVRYGDQRLAGPIMDGYSVDVASQTTMKRYAPLSSILVLCICFLCLESIHATAIVFGMSCVSQAIALAILHHGGGEMTALLIVLPPLIQVLAIAGGIHLVNYTIDVSRASGSEDSVTQAFKIAWLPCSLSSITTAIGLISLTVSGIAAVRQFGLFAAAGVLATLAVLLILLPGCLLIAGRDRLGPTHDPESGCMGKLWPALMKLHSRHATSICAVAIIGMIGLGLGVSRLRASVRIETLFGKHSRLWTDSTWLEEHVGPLVPIEAVVAIPESSGLDAEQQFAAIGRIEQQLRTSPHVEAVTSCLDFLPNTGSPVAGRPGDPVLERVQASIADAGYLRRGDGANHWRLTAHVSSVGDVDYDDVLRKLEASLAVSSQPGYTVTLSGLMPLVHEIQTQLLRDLYASFLTAFVLIAVVMTIVQAGFLAGILSMIPNVFPAIAMFGFLGWIDQPVDIGSIMTASVAMGIAVDDTLHFLTLFTQKLNGGSTRTEAVDAAYTHCGRAMIQTTLICGAGMAIFALSDFIPTARFAWMMVALLTFAIIGDLIILPAILLSPAGIVFEHRQSNTTGA